jgi:aromatic ring hydroxylase
MPMMTAEQYQESLRGLNLVVYMFGKQLDNVVDDPIIRPSMLAVAKTYEMAHRPILPGKKSTALPISIKALMTWSKKARWADF